ncbi:MAG: FAD-dependent oxidoreductase [Pseudomonadota bacterium]|nr:FAD-dependent oxidoreductase [Pseudomonadota bacterium]
MARRPPSRPILIAGGGIAGLSAAIALAQAGRRVTLFERERRFTTAGAGIQLGPNATRRLMRWGVWERIAAKVVLPEAIYMGDGLTGRALASVPLGDHVRERYGAPYALLHRSDLQAGLMAAARAERRVTLKAGSQIVSFRRQDGGIAARPDSGRAIAGDALLCADGLWSALRGSISPGAEPVFSGRTAWRSLIPVAGLPREWRRPAVHLWMAPDAHLVHYPVSGGQFVNVVAVIEDERATPGWNISGDADDLLAAFAQWHRPLRDRLLARAPGWRRWALFTLPGPVRWTKGSAALMGDAAHPVLPFLAQGAALAIEDADMLARVIAESDSGMAVALARYEVARRDRAARVQRASANMGRTYHLSGPARAARNVVLRLAPPSRLLSRLDWLYCV